MRLIPPEDAPFAVVEQAPLTLVWNEPRPGAYGGHSGEYLLGLPCITGNRGETFIPDSVANSLADDLGSDWSISNRGTRIEIANKRHGVADHATLVEAAGRVLELAAVRRFIP